MTDPVDRRTTLARCLGAVQLLDQSLTGYAEGSEGQEALVIAECAAIRLLHGIREMRQSHDD